jgi:hypothetical protein
MSIGNTIIALILSALAVAGAWRWYDSHMRAQTKNQVAASQDVRETAECHLEAFKLRAGINGNGFGSSGCVHGHLHGGTRIRISSRLHRGDAQCRTHI